MLEQVLKERCEEPLHFLAKLCAPDVYGFGSFARDEAKVKSEIPG